MERRSGSLSAERRQRYGVLLAALLLVLLLEGMVPASPAQQVVVTALLGATLVLAMRAGEVRPKLVAASAVVAVLLVALSLVAALTGHSDGAGTRLIGALLVALAPPAVVLGVVRSLRTHGHVRIEAVMGVLCLYLLFGMLFAFVYGALGRWNAPFFAGGEAATASRTLYFSFTTLTTVGYGDFTARTNVGHTLAILEALIGQIYLVTVVSLMVSNVRRPAAS